MIIPFEARNGSNPSAKYVEMSSLVGMHGSPVCSLKASSFWSTCATHSKNFPSIVLSGGGNAALTRAVAATSGPLGSACRFFSFRSSRAVSSRALDVIAVSICANSLRKLISGWQQTIAQSINLNMAAYDRGAGTFFSRSVSMQSVRQSTSASD